jgi:N-6 DNA Methylase
MARNPKRPARRRETRITFDAIVIEGSLLQPELVMRVATENPTPQLAIEYGLDPGEKLRDVVQTKFTLAQSLFSRFMGSDKGPVALKRFLSGFFNQAFEFQDIAESAAVTLDDREFPIGHQALNGRVPIVFAPYGLVDKADRALGDSGRLRAPAQLLQEYLNAQDAALWGLVSDGVVLRLYRDNATLTRPAYIEADLTVIFDPEAPRLADFSALWLLIHASRFGKAGTPVSDCPLERWREEGREKGARARDDLRDGVETALSLLGEGFLAHPANAKLKEELAKGTLGPQAYLDALLRLVYRLIFVFAAEDRNLLHVPQPTEPKEFENWRAALDIYKRGYGLGRLRDLSSKRHAWDLNVDGWEGAKILFRELWRGQPMLALPALGGLFAPGHVRDFSDCRIANKFFYQAIFRLAWLKSPNGLERVNWRDMETEELGSVYESLLELTPNLAGPTGFEFIKAAGHERKTTASYYTPDALVQALLDETLDPLVAERTKGKNGQAAIDALLDLRIIDPACGSGHFLLAAARRLAVQCAQYDKPGAAPSPSDYRHWLREVARRSLYGVDKNPMAIELAKVALWIETVEPGKPLSFLDAHLRCGDSLLGIFDLGALQIGIPDEAYKALTVDDKKAAAEWRKRNKAERDARKQGEFTFFEPPREILEAARALEAQGEDALAEVEAKAERFRAILAGPGRYRMEVACDLYCAAFLLMKLLPPAKHSGERSAFIPTSRDVWDKLGGAQVHGLLEGQAVDTAKNARAFHWPLEFPQVFFPAPGKQSGFDLALGNPPWERIKLQEQEFFASRDARIAQAAKAERQKLIDELEQAAPETPAGGVARLLFDEFKLAKRIAEAQSTFARIEGAAGGRFPRSGVGDVNTYALFSELFSIIARRSGIVVPTELATSDTTKTLFGHLVESGRLQALYDFQTGMGFFDRIGHARFKFVLVALGEPRNTSNPKFKVAFFLRTAAEMADKSRYFEMSKIDIAAINPNTKTAPIFRSKADAELTKQIYARVPVLIDDAKGAEGNPWGIRFQAMFHMSGDSDLFRTAKQLTREGFTRKGRDWVKPVGTERYLPLYEAKMIHHYDHRWATYEDGVGDKDSRNLDLSEKENPEFEVDPRYWVPAREVHLRLTPLPKSFIDAIRSNDEKKITLVVAHIMFGKWLADAGYPAKPGKKRGIFEEWRAFVTHHSGLRKVTPASLGLTPDSPALMRPINVDCLPAVPIDEIIDTPREKTAWHEIDPKALSVLIQTIASHGWLTAPANSLSSSADVLAFADQILEASCPKWLMGWREICRATDERTTISGVIDAIGVGNKFLLLAPTTCKRRAAALLALLSSIPIDFISRQKVAGSSLNIFILKQLAVLTPASISEADLDFIVPRVLELTYTSHSMKPFADDLGYKGNGPFAWDEGRRALLRAELDAKIAKLYGLTRDQLRYILDPADVHGADYPSETFRVLQKNEVAKYGEYRTRRLVLDAWDRIERGEFETTPLPLHAGKPSKKVDLNAIPDGDWARPRLDARAEIGALLVGLLRGLAEPMPACDVRQAAVWAIEPDLLLPHLNNAESAQWRRLIGPEADTQSPAVSKFLANANAAWGSAVTTLRGNKALLTDHATDTWAPGPGLYDADLPAGGWIDGRARFVLDVLKRVGNEKASADLSQDRKGWVVHGKAA